MVAVSVIVAVSDPGADLQGLVRSLDAQSLPTTEFEVVLADASTDGSDVRLRDLAARRPNVVVRSAEAGTSEADLLALARAVARGEHVLQLAQGRRLAPRALEHLLGTARHTGAEVVLGRVAGAGPSGLPDDADLADASAVDLDRVVALVRGAPLLEVAGRPVAVLRRSAIAFQDEAEAVEVGVGAGIRWSGGTLHVEPEVPGPGPARRVLVVARRGGVDVEVPVDGSGAAVLDPWTGDAAGPLGVGVHDLALRVVAPGEETTIPLLPPSVPSSAVIGGRPFVLRAGETGAQLDVGATLGAVAGPAPQRTATITETVSGILLTLDQPSIHVHGDADLDARLLLDGFPLRARLVCRNSVARVETLASSLAGVSRIALAVGGGGPVQTGLRLRVDGTGAMTVEDVPAPKPKAPPKPPPGPPAFVQRVRRLAPAPLEPAVRRLSRVPVLRRAYRALLTR